MVFGLTGTGVRLGAERVFAFGGMRNHDLQDVPRAGTTDKQVHFSHVGRHFMTGGQKSRAVIAIVGFAVTIMAVASACGGSTSSTSSASASPAVSKATEILGHAPTGLAKAIVDNGYVVVADDANYPPQSVLKKNGELVGFDVDVAKKVASLLGLQAVSYTHLRA